VNLTDGQTHALELYLLDWDQWGGGRNEQVQILDAHSGAVLGSQSIANFNSGRYLIWDLSGDVNVVFNNLNPQSNAVLNGLFLDSPLPPAPPAPPATASFVGTDSTTQGSWQGVYGQSGYNVIDNATSYPSFAQISSSGYGNYIWTTTSSDPRALQEIGSNNRIAACWYSSTTFSININLTDGQTHQLALYLVDWDQWGGGRNEQVQILDANSGNILSTETASNFSNGEYLVWTISGDVSIKFTNLNPPSNAIVNGFFLK
jgi:hypothetical protein